MIVFCFFFVTAGDQKGYGLPCEKESLTSSVLSTVDPVCSCIFNFNKNVRDYLNLSVYYFDPDSIKERGVFASEKIGTGEVIAEARDVAHMLTM